MAIWQFGCMVISNKNLDKNIDTEEILSWRGIELSFDIKEFLQDMLPYNKGWSDDIIQYGNADSTCIRLFYEEDSIEEINVRLDLRNLTENIFDLIIEFINKMCGSILYENKIYDAEKKILLNLLKKSNAAKFCLNPQQYFEEKGEILE